MADIKEIARNSNTEVVIKDAKPHDIKSYLAINKCLIPMPRNPEEKIVGFFKIHEGMLQVHVRTYNSKGEEAWHWFTVIDADDNQKARNRSLNISMG